MKTYIINLAEDTDRKAYMQTVLEEQKICDFSFVTAVRGSALSGDEKKCLFDDGLFLKKYAKQPNDAQIGCTLSHRKCYEEFLRTGEQVCLIFEDDIAPKTALPPIIQTMREFLESQSRPAVVLLSGWFWYTKKFRFADCALGSLYAGFLAHSYMMNARAAEALLCAKPYYVADDWHEFKKQFGVQIYGLIPHVINQKWNGEFASSTNSQKIQYEKGYLVSKLRLHVRGAMQKVLTALGKFEGAE